MILNIVGGNDNFWKSLRNADSNLYRSARTLQRLSVKQSKCLLDLSFLRSCVLEELLPKFTRWRNFKTLPIHKRKKEQKRVLRKAQNERTSKLRRIKKQISQVRISVEESATYIQICTLNYLIDCDVAKREEGALKIHRKMLGRLRDEKKRTIKIEKNPNSTVVNLSGEDIDQEELDVLEKGLNYGVCLHPKESQMVASGEVLWDQIERHKLIDLRKRYKVERVKTAIRSFTYTYLDLDSKQLNTDRTIINKIHSLRQKYCIMKADKGNSTVIFKKSDYTNCVEQLFKDKTKFVPVNSDDSLTRLSTVQSFLYKMTKRGEICKELYDTLRPKFANVGRAYGLPKIHKKFDVLPKFRPIVDTMASPYRNIGKYLSELLFPLSCNEFSLKDSFDAAERIRSIPGHLFDEGYKLISFDVVSLFTNVPLLHTVNIILNKVYSDHLISTTLKKPTLKKLVLDCCQKSIFSFNNKLYKQVDGLSMGMVMAPVMAGIVMVDLEEKIIKPLINKNIIKFYSRYVDDTLVLIKPDNIAYVHNLINTYHKNLKFTVDTFDDNLVHFLDLLILDDLSIDIYRKNTFTGNYVDYNSFVPWSYRTSWIRSLIYRAKNICSTNTLLSAQLEMIDQFMAWNNFPIHVRKSLKNKFLKVNPKNKSRSNSKIEKVLWLRIPYFGPKSDFLVKKLKQKLKKHLNEFELRVIYKCNKISMFCSNKDKIKPLNKANVIYKFKCPGCSEEYIGKTERNLVTRLKEHGNGEVDSAINLHLQQCSLFKDMISFNNILLNGKLKHYDLRCNTILSNTCILDYHNNWSYLSFLESYYIKYFNPSLNTGSRAARELKLF